MNLVWGGGDVNIHFTATCKMGNLGTKELKNEVFDPLLSFSKNKHFTCNKIFLKPIGVFVARNVLNVILKSIFKNIVFHVFKASCGQRKSEFR